MARSIAASVASPGRGQAFVFLEILEGYEHVCVGEIGEAYVFVGV